MHRSKPLLILTICTLIICAGIALVQAQATPTAYLPLIHVEIPPTPIPTPIPPNISTLPIQLAEMKSGFVLETFKEVTNADAAKGYKDQKGALKAFQTQGRETSWYAVYTSVDYEFSDALIVASQVNRYLTTDGAIQGFQLAVGKAQQDHPDYRQFALSAPCCPTIIGFRRTFTQDNLTVDQFDTIVEYGRYVSEVQMIGLTGVVGPDLAAAYGSIALTHIFNTPQVIQSSDHSMPAGQIPPAGAVPSLESLRAAMTPR